MARRLSALTIGVLMSAAALAAQQSRDAAAPIPPSGRISGSVVNAESGRPIRFARVFVDGPGGTVDVVTGDDGSFVFERLVAGHYRLGVAKSGYLDMAYGQARPGTLTPGKRITLADKQQIERVVLPLSQGGSISGVVRDERGEPMYRASVRVGRWVMRHGLRVLEGVDGTATDERGRYRVSLLPSRDYVVVATPGEDAVPESKRSPITQSFAPVFFPGALSSRSASLVSIGPGEERADVDITLPLVQLGRVTGVVVGTDSWPVPGMPVALTDTDDTDRSQGTETDRLGRFSFDRVVPGSYTVIAGAHGHTVHFSAKKFVIDAGEGEYTIAMDMKKKIMSNDVSLMFAEAHEKPKAEVPPGSASGEVTVASNNTSDLTLTLEPPRTVVGRIVSEGASKPPSLRGAVVTLTARSPDGEEVDAKVAADGTFTMPNVAPGKYIVSFAGEAPPWNLASAMSNGVDALDFLLEVPRDRDVRDLLLTMRDKSSELSGTVTDAEGKPAPDRIAIVFPADERLWIAGDRRIKAAPLGADGKFAFDDMRPGAYLLAITDSLENDEWLNPDLLKKLIGAAVSVNLAEGEKRVQDLRIR